MKPKRIFLVRHGESEGNVDGTVYSRIPDHKISLTGKGRTQAVSAGEIIKSTIGIESVQFYVSPHARTRQTFDGIAKAFSPGQYVKYEEPRLREQEWGHLRSAAETEELQKLRYQYGTFYFRIPNGESGADGYDRVSTFLETMFRDFQKEDFADNVVIVSHGLTIRLFVMRWFHSSVEDFESWRNPYNCEIYVMKQNENGKYELDRPMAKEN